MFALSLLRLRKTIYDRLVWVTFSTVAWQRHAPACLSSITSSSLFVQLKDTMQHYGLASNRMVPFEDTSGSICASFVLFGAFLCKHESLLE